MACSSLAELVHVVLVAGVLSLNVFVRHPVLVHDLAGALWPLKRLLGDLSTVFLQFPEGLSIEFDLVDSAIGLLLLEDVAPVY